MRIDLSRNFIVFQSPRFDKDIKKYKRSNIWSSLVVAANNLNQDPYLGTKYKGNTYQGYRHIRINKDYRILYVICREMRQMHHEHFEQAVKKRDLSFSVCKFCKAACIDIPENGVFFLAIMKHKEQDRRFA
ncbi:MAG: type II toxin-antitoxin system mRNA interferase toxin, RelE/StbE family [Candidatus Lokiarchaeota archaeon]|nr:type II toxin-antitoxin system mRNA interferase toxin, RelE/StbE family [Candidatus Lokiarchaeota archaeon]